MEKHKYNSETIKSIRNLTTMKNRWEEKKINQNTRCNNPHTTNLTTKKKEAITSQQPIAHCISLASNCMLFYVSWIVDFAINWGIIFNKIWNAHQFVSAIGSSACERISSALCKLHCMCPSWDGIYDKISLKKFILLTVSTSENVMILVIVSLSILIIVAAVQQTRNQMR